MKKYEGIEELGAAMNSFIEGMDGLRSTALKILADNGLEEPLPDKWYPFDNWVNVLNMIIEKVGPSTLFHVGKRIPENAVFPPLIDSVENALSSLGQAYRMNKRGSNLHTIGDFAYTKIDNNTAKVVCDTPYPCDFDRGIIEATANKYKAPGQIVKVAHDPSECRKNNGKKCAYIVTW